MAVRRMLLMLVLAALLLPASAHATFMTFTDRAAWEAAVAGAGLAVATEDFASDPGLTFSIEGRHFEIVSGIHNAASQDLSPAFDNLEIDFLGGAPLYGLGMEFRGGFGLIAGFPVVSGSDGTQAASQGGSLGAFSDFFLGILSTEPLVPACTGCSSSSEVTLPVQVGGALMFADNLSVAVVPEPGTGILLAFGLAGLASARRRRA